MKFKEKLTKEASQLLNSSEIKVLKKITSGGSNGGILFIGNFRTTQKKLEIIGWIAGEKVKLPVTVKRWGIKWLSGWDRNRALIIKHDGRTWSTSNFTGEASFIFCYEWNEGRRIEVDGSNL
jgi:hypothetical protein